MGIVDKNTSEDIERCTESLFVRIKLLCKLGQLEIPQGIVDKVMTRCPEVEKLDLLEVAEAYFKLLELGMTKTAAATVASSDYLGRGKEDALDTIARNYQLAKLAYGYHGRMPDNSVLQKYRKIADYPEARLALLAMSDYVEDVEEDNGDEGG